MTTIIGMQTNYKGIEAIVMGSDTQLSWIDEDGKMDSKGSRYKINIGPNWVLADAGSATKPLNDFYDMLQDKSLRISKLYENEGVSGAEIIAKAIRSHQAMSKKNAILMPHFREVTLLNAFESRKGVEAEGWHTFILAVNSPQLSLYRIDDFGNLFEPDEEEFSIVYIGSGQDKARAYIDAQLRNIDPRRLDVPKSIDLVYNGLIAAQEDANTGGLPDIVVLTKDSIQPYGKSLATHVDSAVKSFFEEVKKTYE